MAQFEDSSDKALRIFADLMIEKIKEVQNNWKKPWFSTQAKGWPQNLFGRQYSGINSMMLYIIGEKKNYTLPVFMTFNQAKDNNVSVKKGEKSFPVLYWNFNIKGATPENRDVKITLDEYNKLSKEEKGKFKVIPYLKNYNVFNVEQTTFPEQKPEEWKSLLEKFKAPDIKDGAGMFACPEVDAMLKNQNWVCPIHLTTSDKAFFVPMADYINTPLKGQFIDGQSFYATLLHEMAHSTGTESRLNREHGGVFGDAKYAKEELIAELTAAMTCQSLGISSTIREENATYLKSWLGSLNEEPNFILTILSDANKAMNMINNVVQNQSITAGEELKKRPDEIKQANNFLPEELPFKDFKTIGVNPADISKEDMKILLEGKPTNNTITIKVRDSKNTFKLDVHLSLKRNPDKSVSLILFPVKDTKKELDIQQSAQENNKSHKR